jgi:hypothetical protein
MATVSTAARRGIIQWEGRRGSHLMAASVHEREVRTLSSFVGRNAVGNTRLGDRIRGV